MKKKRPSIRIIALAVIVAMQTVYFPWEMLLAETVSELESLQTGEFICPAHTVHDELCEYERYGVCMHICLQCLAEKSPLEEIEERPKEEDREGLQFDFGDENDMSWLDESINSEIEEPEISEDQEEEKEEPVKFLITSITPLGEEASHIRVLVGNEIAFPSELEVTSISAGDYIPELPKEELPPEQIPPIGELPDETPDETPDEKPDETPDEKPDETPDEKPDETPDEKPDETPDEKPDEIPDEKPDEIPDEKPDEIPDEKPDETPDEKPDETPDEKPDETPDEKPDETPDEKPDETPDGTPNKTAAFHKRSIVPIKQTELIRVSNTLVDTESELNNNLDGTGSEKGIGNSLEGTKGETEKEPEGTTKGEAEKEPEETTVESIPVTWRCTEEYSGQVGTYTFVPVLPGGYAFADGVTSPEITVNVIPQKMLMRGGMIGIGTKANPIQIDSGAALYEFAQRYNDGSLRQIYNIPANELVYVKLIADIDLSAYQSGSGFPSIGHKVNPFLGCFDGNGYTVSHLFMRLIDGEQRPNQEKPAGLFGAVARGSVIENLGVRNAVLRMSDFHNTWDQCGGIIAGELAGRLRNCYTTGTVIINGGYGVTGGVVGRVKDGGEIDTVWTIAEIDPQFSFRGTGSAGGISGELQAGGTIQNAVVLSKNIIGDLTSTSRFTAGRITAKNTGGTLANNMAWTGTNYSADGTGETSNEKNGESKTAMFLVDSKNWPASFRAAPWVMEAGSLPYLENSEKVPFHLTGYTNVNLSGEGTKTNPFLIENKDDLLYFAKEVNNGRKFSGIYIQLEDDIDLEGAEWTPIGSYSKPFQGYFNGGKHKVRDFKINLPNENCVGFFGSIEYGSVFDFGVENCEINGNEDVGALIGTIYYNGEVTRCYVKNAVVTGKDSCIGGLIGRLGSIQIYECFAQDVDVRGSNCVGGLVGYTYSWVGIHDVYTTGKVTSYTGSTAGGIIGNMNADSNVLKNSFTTASVYYDKKGSPTDLPMTGGITGISVGYVENSVCLSQTIEGYNQGGCGSISGSYFVAVDDYWNLYNNKAWEGIISGGWQQVGNNQKRGELLSAEVLKNTENWGFDNSNNLWAFDDENGKLPRLVNVPASEPLDFPVWVSGENLQLQEPDGAGTEDNPYKIATPKNLFWLHQTHNAKFEDFNVNAGTAAFKPTYFIQTADIDLSGYNVPWIGIGNYPLDYGGFFGNYDGKGHAIIGLKGSKGVFDHVSKSISKESTSNSYFYMDENMKDVGVVKNLSVLDCQLEGIYVGGIATTTNGAEIINCAVTGSMHGDSVTGGIVGMAYDSSITGCYTDAEITVEGATGNAGGIAGFYFNTYVTKNEGKKSYIENVQKIIKPGLRFCYSKGPVTVTFRNGGKIGGIAGDAGIEARNLEIDSRVSQYPVKIERCYTTSPLYISRSENSTGDMPLVAGGLIGRVQKSSGDNINRNVLTLTGCVALNPYVILGENSQNGDAVSKTIASIDNNTDMAISECHYWKDMALSGAANNDVFSILYAMPVEAQWFWYEETDETMRYQLTNSMSHALMASLTFASRSWQKRNYGELPILKDIKTPPQSGQLPEHLRKPEEDKPGVYTISSEGDLKRFQEMVNQGSVPGYIEKIELANNIYLTKNWTPMGTKDKPFTWEFDGKGNRIENLTINKPSSDYVGFIGYLDGGVVKNTVFTVNKVTSSRKYTGAIVGYAKSTGDPAVTSCAVTYEADREAIHVEGGEYSGGIIGGQELAGVEYSYVNLNVKGRTAGGVIGISQGTSSAAAYNQYNIAAGSVTGTSCASGIIGESNTNGLSYNSMALQKSVLSDYSRWCGPIYGKNGSGESNRYWIGMETGENMAGAAADGGMDGAALQEKNGWQGAFTNGVNFQFSPGKLPEIKSLSGKYDTSFPYYLGTSGLKKDSQGRFKLSTPEDLETMQKQVGAVEEYTNGKYILQNDIDMKGVALSSIGVYDPGNMKPNSKATYFCGELDGNGYAIQNLTIKDSGSATGLFSYLGAQSKVHNLTLDNVTVTGSSNTGALAGVAEMNSTITDITVTGSVSGGENTGGLVGAGNGLLERIRLENLTVETSDALITNQNTGGIAGSLLARGTLKDSAALSTVRVTGQSYTGGLVGTAANGSSIETSYVLGSVEGSFYVGGIAGNIDGSISECYMAGSISGRSNVGGIAGYARYRSSIKNVYSTSSIIAESIAGGIVGSAIGIIEYAYSTGSVSGTKSNGGIAGSLTKSGTGANSGTIRNTAALNNSVSNGSRIVGINHGSDRLQNNLSWDMGLSTPGDNLGNGTILEKNQFWTTETWAKELGFQMNKSNAAWEMKENSLPILARLNKDQDDSLPLHLTGVAIGDDLSIKLLPDQTDFTQSAARQYVNFAVEYTGFENVSQKEVLWSIQAGGKEKDFVLKNTIGQSNQITIPAGYYGKFTVTGSLQSNSDVSDSQSFEIIKTFGDDLGIAIVPDNMKVLQSNNTQQVGLKVEYMNFENESRRDIIWEIKNASSQKDGFQLVNTKSETNTLTVPGGFLGTVTIGAKLAAKDTVNTEYVLTVQPDTRELKPVPDKLDIKQSVRNQQVDLTVDYINFDSGDSRNVVWEVLDASSQKDGFQLKDINSSGTNTLTIPGGFLGTVTIGVKLADKDEIQGEVTLTVKPDGKAITIVPEKTDIMESASPQQVGLMVKYMNFDSGDSRNVVWEVLDASSQKDGFQLKDINSSGTNTLTIPGGFLGTVTIGVKLADKDEIQGEVTLTVKPDGKAITIVPEKTDMKESASPQQVGLTVKYMNFDSGSSRDVIWEVLDASSQKDGFQLKDINSSGTNTLTIPSGFNGTVTIGVKLREDGAVKDEVTLTVKPDGKAITIVPEKTDMKELASPQQVGLTVKYMNFDSGSSRDVIWEVLDASSQKDGFQLENTNSGANTLTIPSGFNGTVTIGVKLREDGAVKDEVTLTVKPDRKAITIVPEKTDMKESASPQQVGLMVKYMNFDSGSSRDVIWEVLDASSQKDGFQLENTNSGANTLTIPSGFNGTVTIGVKLREDGAVKDEVTLTVKPDRKAITIVPEKTDMKESASPQQVGLMVEYLNFENESKRGIVWEVLDASSQKDGFQLENTNTGTNTLTIPGGFHGTVTVGAKWKEDAAIAAQLTLTVEAVQTYSGGGGGRSYQRKPAATRQLKGVVDEAGKLTIMVTLENVNDLLRYVKENGDACFIASSEEPYTAIEYILSADAVKKLVESKISSIRFDSNFAYFAMDRAALQKVDTGETLHIDISPAENTGMWAGLLLSGNPAYEFSLLSGNGESYHQFSPGKVEIGIYFTGKQGKNYRLLYVDENGMPSIEENSVASQDVVSVQKDSLSIYGVAEKKAGQVFDDTKGHWAEGMIQEVVDMGLMAGVGGKAFAPEEPMTRAMFVTVLARLSGEDLTEFTNEHYSDVEKDSYYEAAVAWASEKGIVSGTGDGKFEPGRVLTREEMAVMLDKFLALMGIFPQVAEKAVFTDIGIASPWAKESILRLYQSGYINGKSDNQFDPKGKLKRSEGAAVFLNVVKHR